MPAWAAVETLLRRLGKKISNTDVDSRNENCSEGNKFEPFEHITLIILRTRTIVPNERRNLDHKPA